MIDLYFIKNFSSTKLLPNFGQIQIFINLIDDLINNFEQCEEMKPTKLKAEIKKNKELESLKNIRAKIIEYYIDLVVRFSSISYESILENQEVAAENQKNMEFKLSNEYKEKLIKKLNEKRIISYKEIKPSVVLFNPKNDNEDDSTCSIITSCDEKSDEYKQLKVLFVKYLKQPCLYEIIEYDDLGKESFIRELYNICSTSKNKIKEINKEEKLKNYEFTSDNYIKMVLIYLRIRAKVPLILLGETGCGKTSLIKALSYFLEDRYKLIQFNIHSGISYQDILSFLHVNNLLVERKNDNDIKLFELIKEEEEEKKDLENSKNNKENIILFIDEINTTNSINLLVELFTSHSFIGYSLRENVYVIGACNPYRLMLSKNEEIGYTNKKRHRIRNLIYTVNPLPLSLINYIFDFGNLKEEEEKKYINSFVDSFLFTSFNKNKEIKKKEENNTEIYEEIFEIISKAVFYCQKFIRENSEISSVSLREIERFKKFFEFFFDITVEKYKLNEKENFKDLYLKTANLALYLCYYIRILENEKREELSKKLEEILGFKFLNYPYELENYIADNMELSKGIAKNRALLDNLFTLFVCLNVKVPIFICGKAGCSKTLSFSLLYQSMKGEYSKSELFKKYLKLYVSSYQGSLTSNSSEIQNIFKRAKNISRKTNEKNENNNEINKNEKNDGNDKDEKKENKNDNNNKNDDNINNNEENKKKIISVILFDEMGLAEISPNNPLKVIHSELDDNNDEIGFVGISNWSLDASKMNRGVHLSIQEPNEEDLINTAITIVSGINDDISAYDKIIENLARSYYDYKKFLLKKYQIFYDFHGARDFYNLIKITARMLKNNKQNSRTIENIAMESIERNFGGLELEERGDNNNIIKFNSSKKFKQIFSEYQQSNVENIDRYDVYSCIQKNLEEENNRYLLLITDKTKNDTLVEFILKKLNLDYRFIQGSKLTEDQNEGYVLQKSWSIITSMEKGEIIILKDMEILYPKFYDLFNQNLQKYGNSFYARIVLDSTTNERHIVNDKFRCIILLNKNNVNEQDPPFLNRFEKHLISFQYLLNDEQNRIAVELFEEIKELTTIPETKGIKPLLVNINIEEIRSLILEISLKEENIEKNINLVYKLLIPTFSQENILSSIFSQEKKYLKKEDLIQIYEENNHTNVYKYLEKVDKNKLVIYTFSPYFKDLFKENYNVKIENKIFGNICKDNTLEIIFNEKLSESMLNYFFEIYYEKNNCNLFVIHFKDKHSKYLKYIKFLLDDYHKKVNENQKKIFLFIIHIKKNKQNVEKYHSNFFSFLSEYQQITIDNIAEQKNFSIIDLYKKTNENLLLTKELFDINLIIKKEFSRQIIGMNKNCNISFIDKLDNLSYNGILESIIKAIQNLIKNYDNLLRQFFIDYSNLKYKDDDFIRFFVEKIEKLISDNVEKLIKELVNSGYFVSFIFEKDIPEKIKKSIILFIDNINLLNLKTENNINNHLLDLKIPGSKLLFQKFYSLLKNCKNEYINKENECRKSIKKKLDTNNLKEITLEDVHFEKKQYLKSCLWNEELLSDNFFNDYYNEIIQDFFYLLFYNDEKNITINQKQLEFLLFLYNKKNTKDNLLDTFLYFFLWAGSYQEKIFKLLEIIGLLSKFFVKKNKNNNQPDILEHIISLYDSTKFEEEKNDEKKEQKEKSQKEKVNEIFYKISESICETVINVNIIDYSNIDDINKLCTNLNNIYQIFSEFNTTLSLSLKKQYSINSIVKLIEYFIKEHIKKEKSIDRNIINNFIQKLYEEYKYLLNNNINDAIKSFKEQLDIIDGLSDKLSMIIFENKLLEYYKNEDYKLEMVKILFKYPNLIKYSFLFFNYIFLLLPIKPKKLKEKIDENEKKEYFKKFCEIKSIKTNKILMIINQEAETNEILKEILIYIFELRINSYFEDCQKNKFIQKSPIKLLIGLNFDYFKICGTNIEKQSYGELKNIGIIFYFSFIRCYLTYFVKLQLKEKELGDLNKIHEYLFNNSNSVLGKLISLYISKLFFLYDKKEYFLNTYLKEEKYNWKLSILDKNDRVQLFSIKNYENSTHLILNLWTEIINKNELSDSLREIEITDLSYIINFCYNEINQKMNEKKIVVNSELIEKINQIKECFNFKPKINYKIKKIFEKMSVPEFFNKEIIQSNLKLFFNMIKLYIISYTGYKENLTSLIFSQSVIDLIKIYYSNNVYISKNLTKSIFDLFKIFYNNNNYENPFVPIECFYKTNEILEEKNDKNEDSPVYICTCGKIFLSYQEQCQCGLKITIIVFYDENQKKKFENVNNNKNEFSKYKKYCLSELKEFMIFPLLEKDFSFEEKLLNNEIINDNNFATIFINYIFLCQINIEYFILEDNYKIDFKKILDLTKSIETYFETKKINIDYYFNMFSDYYINFLQKNDYIKKKSLLKEFIESTLKIKNIDESFKNIETNILTKLFISEENNEKKNSNKFDINLKYLLTATKYPDIDELKKALSLQKTKSLPILRTFISWEKNSDLYKLLYIEKINNFINAFAEENQNLISRQKIEEDKIEKYLKKEENSVQENTSLNDKFKEFCEAYDEITNIPPYNMSMSQPVKTILNDKHQKTQIYLFYCHLIEIQNDFLMKVINQFNSNKN